MSLENAHKGYEYQDLLTAVFIINELLFSRDTVFTIDRKENQYDKFDDLSYSNELGVFKRQVKYSESKTLEKADFSQEKYDLALDTLFLSWKSSQSDIPKDYRLCLAWEYLEDEDSLDFLKTVECENVYGKVDVKYLKIDINKIWTESEKPISAWRRLRSKSDGISRDEFSRFIDELIIEVNLPKISHDLFAPGQLESIAIQKLTELGIGKYPNDNLDLLGVLSMLIVIIKGARASGNQINTSDILYKLGIQTSFGSIEQEFRIHKEHNVVIDEKIENFVNRIEQNCILIGAPGSGKSWFVNNLVSYLRGKNIRIVRHFCYTGINDEFGKDRITKNVFLANLINEILIMYPELKSIKTTKYGVDLDELQEIINSMSEETWIIVDGLDHIERVYNLHKDTMKKVDTEIVEVIKNISIPKNVKLLLVSQPVTEVLELEEQGFSRLDIPKWELDEVSLLMKLYYQDDKELRQYERLSDYLLNKSEGNPLYLTYILKEINRYSVDSLTLEVLDLLPNYSKDLSVYYSYLLQRIEEGFPVSHVLAGAHFYLNESELNEITHLGNYIKLTLDKMRSVLEFNASNGGYLIYHESFRRFIIEVLESNGVDPAEVIYSKLIDWLKIKGFYSNRKSYFNLLHMLYEARRYNEIVGYINTNFVIDSMVYGHSVSSIKRNYSVLVKAASKLKDYKAVIIITEISGMIDGLEYSFEENEELYYKCIGNLFGYDYLKDLLVFEGKMMLPLVSGLKVCYICSSNGIVPHWEPYIDLIVGMRDNDKLPDWREEEHKFIYKAFIAANLDLGKDITQIVKNSSEPKCHEKRSIIIGEYNSRNRIDELKEIVDSVGLLHAWQQSFETYLKYRKIECEDFESILNELESANEERKSIFITLKRYIKSIQWIAKEHLVKLKMFTVKISNRNWFHNWLIYVAKVNKVIISNQDSENIEELIIDTYKILLEDTEKFKGKPRTCDLYEYREIIYESLLYPLCYISSESGWKEIISLLQELSGETETYLRGSHTGPLTSDRLVELYLEVCNDINVHYIINAIENQIKKDENSSLYSYLADYSFKKGSAFASANMNDKSIESLKNGVKYLLAYTFRKDRTLSHILDSVEATMGDELTGLQNILSMKTLADAVVNHTDGRSTKTYPKEWYEVLLNNNMSMGLAYLCEILPQYACHWLYEECLKETLIAMNGSVSMEVEAALYKTLPNCKESDYLNSYLNVIDKLFESGNTEIGMRNLHELCSRLSVNDTEKINDYKLLDRLKKTCVAYAVNWNTESYIRNSYKEHEEKSPSYGQRNNNVSREKSFDKFSYDEIVEYVSKNGIRDSEYQALVYYFETISELTNESIIFIDSFTNLFLIGLYYTKDWNKYIELVDSVNAPDDVKSYIYIQIFLRHRDGWMQRFTRKDIFAKAFLLSQEITENALFYYVSHNMNSVEYSFTIGGNLINALAECGWDVKLIQEYWYSLFEIINFRLPGQEEFVWDNIKSVDTNWHDKEKLIYLLFSRLRFGETYRTKWIFAELDEIFANDEYKQFLAKPLKRFMNNNSDYLDYELAMVLILYLRNNDSVHCISSGIESTLHEIYPTNMLLSDYVIRKMLRKNKTRLVIEKDEDLRDISKKLIDWLCMFDARINRIQTAGIEPAGIVKKYTTMIKEQTLVKEYRDLLYDDWHHVVVPNLYFYNALSQYIMEEIEKELSHYAGTPLEEVIEEQLYNEVLDDFDLMISECKSLRIRPENIPEFEDVSDFHVVERNGWVRVGYFERLYESRTRRGDFYENNDSKIKIGALVFGASESEDLPVLFLNDLYKFGEESNFVRRVSSLHDFQIIMTTNLRLLEDMNLSFNDRRYLALRGEVLSYLGIKIVDSLDGIVGINSKGECVLRYSNWRNAVSEIDSNSSYFIPYLDGAQLELRKNEYEKLCNAINRSVCMKNVII